eukprot:scaffold118932_cov57-Phaeocystis_antarctica.AAC.1
MSATMATPTKLQSRKAVKMSICRWFLTGPERRSPSLHTWPVSSVPVLRSSHCCSPPPMFATRKDSISMPMTVPITRDHTTVEAISRYWWRCAGGRSLPRSTSFMCTIALSPPCFGVCA